MGKIAIIYHSKEGCTEKMANLISEGVMEIPEIELRIRSLSEASVEDIYWCDGLALGCPTYLGLVSAEMKAFWEGFLPDWQKIDGKIGCAFSSQGGWGGGGELACQSLMTLMMNFGFLVFGVTDYVGEKFTAHYGAVQAGEPRADKEAAACRRMGRRLAEWVAVYADGRREHHPVNHPYPRNHWDLN